MKKFIAKEFLWLVLTALLSLPLGLLFLWLLGFTNESAHRAEQEKDYIFRFYIIGYVLSFLGVYLMRFVILAIYVVTGRNADPNAENQTP